MIPKEPFLVWWECPYCEAKEQHVLDVIEVNYKERIVFFYLTCMACNETDGQLYFLKLREFNQICPKKTDFN